MSSARRNRVAYHAQKASVTAMEEQAAALLDDLGGFGSDQAFCEQAEVVLDALRTCRDSGVLPSPAVQQYLDRALQGTPASELVGHLQQVVGRYARAEPADFSRAVFTRFTEEQITLGQAIRLAGLMEPMLAIQVVELLERIAAHRQIDTCSSPSSEMAVLDEIVTMRARATAHTPRRPETRHTATSEKEQKEEPAPSRSVFNIALERRPRRILMKSKK